jgi:hypothetical protein
MKPYRRESEMKRILIYFGVTMAVLFSMGCKKEGDQRSYFSTPQEAANKAKNDLLAVLRSRKDIALGLEQQTIEKSQPAASLKQYQITFEDLASADSFTALRRNELATIVPLVADGAVASVVGLAKGETGWKIASLGDKTLSSELDVVRRAVGPQAEIAIYDLPHSGEKVYAVMQPATGGGGTTLYTNYTGFNLKEPVPADHLLPVLKQDAAEFQRKYGDELKRQRIVR